MAVNKSLTRARVEFVGFGNVEIVPLENLLPSLGEKARQDQLKAVTNAAIGAEAAVVADSAEAAVVADSADVAIVSVTDDVEKVPEIEEEPMAQPTPASASSVKEWHIGEECRFIDEKGEFEGSIESFLESNGQRFATVAYVGYEKTVF
jgi:hypothetical protein